MTISLNDYLYECYPTLSASFNKPNVTLFMEVAKEALYTDTQTTEEELVDIIHAELRKSEGRKTSALDIVRALNSIEANKEQAIPFREDFEAKAKRFFEPNFGKRNQPPIRFTPL